MTDPYRPETPCPNCAAQSSRLERVVAWLRVHVDVGHIILGSLFVMAWALTFGVPGHRAVIGWTVVGASVAVCGLDAAWNEFDLSDTTKRVFAAGLANAALIAVALAVLSCS